MSEHNDIDLVSAKQLRAYFRISQDQLTQLRAEGIPTRGSGPGTRYPLSLCIPWFIERQVQKQFQKLQSKVATSDLDKDEATARKLTAEALIKEVELEQLRGTLVNYRDAEAELAKHLGIVRNSLLSFPARVAPYLVAIKTELEAREMMERKVNDLMNQMAKQTEEIDVQAEEDEMEDDE
jgi:hypothetical protein